MTNQARHCDQLGDRVFAAAAADYLSSSVAELKGVASRCGFRDVAVLLALAEQAAGSLAADRATGAPRQRRGSLSAIP
jgi:hypothetical protein